MGQGDFRELVAGSSTAARRALARLRHPSAGGGVEQRRIERDLATCVERGQIEVVFQPVVDLVSSRIVAAEALVRWQHPAFGQIAPDRFIEAAERSGAIVAIGRHVLDTAIRQMVVWNAGRGHADQLSMHVNVSVRQLDDNTLVDDVRRVLDSTAIDPALLVLEITESAALSSNAAFDALATLKTLGVTLAIDDFGTGYSSLSYLAWLPVDEIKIDKSFLADMSREQNRTVLASMILLAGRLGLDTVIEGIEHADQVSDLIAIGARYGQGYHFARPLSAADFGRRLSQATTSGRVELAA